MIVEQVQLRQLRDMGIADEGLARQALQMTGGDVQAALAYIFGDV
jgi:UBA/TS-N domain